MVSLVGCLVPRTVDQLRGLRTPPVVTPRNLARLPHAAERTVAEPIAAVEERVRVRLRGWRARWSDEPGLDSAHPVRTVSAERGHLRDVGNLVFHLSLLGLLVAFAVGKLFGYEGQVIVLSGGGQFCNTGILGYDSFRAGLRVDRRFRPPPHPRRLEPQMAELWVFGYGSLMWRPGFQFAEQAPARLMGAHRALCVYSVVHRGTEADPGLVLGLDKGGACTGIAFRVEPGVEDETVAYLRTREQVTDVYVERSRPITLLDGSNHKFRALCYLVDPKHPQYAGMLSLEQQLRIVRNGKGQAGGNIEYVLNTVRHLEKVGVHDPLLSALAAQLAG